jgi:hypothetical protein
MVSMKTIIRMATLLFLTALAGCSSFTKVTRTLTTPKSIQWFSPDQLLLMRQSSPFIKAHMKNNNVYVLKSWALDSTRKHTIGEGVLFNANRDTLQKGKFQIDLDSVAIFETNVIEPSGTIAAMTVFTGITAAITVYCIANPKACFGSCPTFYVMDEDSLRPQAEGFSASIAPSLEATDVDALYRAKASGKSFEIEMRNEALETHVVRHVDLLVVPRVAGHRVYFGTDGCFWESDSLFHPASAMAPEGDCLPLLFDADGFERYSVADSTNLESKEIIELEFERIPRQSYGLIIGCRQTLLSTYLLYQTYAYMGNSIGNWFTKIENHQIPQTRNPIQNLLGGIEVMVQDSIGDWQTAGQVKEYGPLAADQHLVPLGRLQNGPMKIRLRMTQGNWRIDDVALASLTRPVQAVHLHPDLVLKNGFVDDRARELLCNSTEALVTLPGDTYTLRYRLPAADSDWELFLESRGYYLEWIRKEWIEEENPALLSEMFLNPQAAMKRLAPEFKRVEAEMEDCFWRSRFANPQ